MAAQEKLIQCPHITPVDVYDWTNFVKFVQEDTQIIKILMLCWIDVEETLMQVELVSQTKL